MSVEFCEERLKRSESVAVGVRGLPTGEVTKRSEVETKYRYASVS